jgi:capsular exopolysaccharide synthesis family protein
VKHEVIDGLFTLGRPMTLHDYVQVLRRQWRIITGCVIAALAVAVATIVASTPVYSSSIQLFVSTPVGDSASLSNAFSGSQFSQQRVKSYADIVNTPAVTQPIIDRLHLPFTAADLAGKISASAPLDTVLVNVSVSDTDKVRAAAIANAVGQQLVAVVKQLETPAGGGVSPLKVSVVKNATVPNAPVSPKKSLDLALGLLLGLAIGAGAALVRERLDNTVKNPHEVDELLAAPMLAVVAFDPSSEKRPLVMQSAPSSTHAEAFRKLRTNLQFVNVDERPRSVVVTSSVSGEGKSVTAANLALTLAESGMRVLLMDGDLRKPRIATYLGLEGAAGLTTVLSRQAAVEDVIQLWGTRQLAVLPSGSIPPNPAELLGSQQMINLLSSLRETFDMVVIDAPPLLPVTDAAVLATIADGAMLVVRHGSTTHDQLHQAVRNLRNVDAAIVGSVLNMAPVKGPDAYYYATYYGEEQNASQANGRGRRRRPVSRPVETSPSGYLPDPATAGSERP